MKLLTARTASVEVQPDPQPRRGGPCQCAHCGVTCTHTGGPTCGGQIHAADQNRWLLLALGQMMHSVYTRQKRATCFSTPPMESTT